MSNWCGNPFSQLMINNVAEHATLHTLAIPIYPELSDEQMAYVVERIKAFFLKS